MRRGRGEGKGETDKDRGEVKREGGNLRNHARKIETKTFGALALIL